MDYNAYINWYKTQAQQAQNPGMRDIYNQKAQEYQDNYNYLQELYGARNADDADALEAVIARKGQYGIAGEEAQKIFDSEIGGARQRKAERKAAEDAKKRREAEVATQKRTLIAQQGDQSRRRLAEGMAGIRNNASQRGLLYSGLARGAEAGAQAQAGAAMSNYQAQVNQASDQKVSELSNQAATQGIQDYGRDIDRSNEAYKQALGRYKQKAGALGEIGKGLGTLGAALPI